MKEVPFEPITTSPSQTPRRHVHERPLTGLEAFDPPRYRFHRRTAKTGGCQASSQLPNRESRSRQGHIGDVIDKSRTFPIRRRAR